VWTLETSIRGKLFSVTMEPVTPEETIDPETRERLDRLDNGAVLLARDVLQDPNFIATVVLICIYTRDGGAYGLVLNRPAHMPLSEIFDGFGALDGPREVCIGGPVQQDELQVLRITDEPQPESFQVGRRVYLGGKWQSIDQMLEFDRSSTRLFLGYSGWAAGQLEGEIAAGAWEVYRVDLEKLLGNSLKVFAADVNTIASFLESIRT
jgi:putative transcriptional regulator